MISAEDYLSVYLHKLQDILQMHDICWGLSVSLSDKLQDIQHLLEGVCQFICTNYKIHDICWELYVSLSAQIKRYTTSAGDCLSVYLHKLQDTLQMHDICWGLSVSLSDKLQDIQHLLEGVCQFICTNYKIHYRCMTSVGDCMSVYLHKLQDA